MEDSRGQHVLAKAKIAALKRHESLGLQGWLNVQDHVLLVTFASNYSEMEITTFTDFRQNMKAYFEKVLNKGVPLFISRPKGHDVVLLSKSEYNSMQETFHLIKSPKNAERLLKALEQDKAGGGTERELLD